jgi:hypothetical protein
MITETVTFDIDADSFPEPIRCSCLATGRICTVKILHEHNVIEWKAGSVLATGESIVYIAGEEVGVVVKKEGRPRIYKGWCKINERVDVSGTERLGCIKRVEEEHEHVAEVESMKMGVLKREKWAGRKGMWRKGLW